MAWPWLGGYFPSMPFKHNACRRHHCVTNRSAYEAGLRRRGDLTLWLDEAALAGWAPPKRSSPGGQLLYSEWAIELVLTLRLVFHLALRRPRRSAAACFSCSGWLCPSLTIRR